MKPIELSEQIGLCSKCEASMWKVHRRRQNKHITLQCDSCGKEEHEFDCPDTTDFPKNSILPDYRSEESVVAAIERYKMRKGMPTYPQNKWAQQCFLYWLGESCNVPKACKKVGISYGGLRNYRMRNQTTDFSLAIIEALDAHKWDMLEAGVEKAKTAEGERDRKFFLEQFDHTAKDWKERIKRPTQEIDVKQTTALDEEAKKILANIVDKTPKAIEANFKVIGENHEEGISSDGEGGSGDSGTSDSEDRPEDN